ncbi:MAG: ParB N-terminal domain-containing protein [Deltaproteobacteria bacterium]|nr:ParB N-terminal domain-containing protein [Deltaproteobacteria bacterium]
MTDSTANIHYMDPALLVPHEAIDGQNFQQLLLQLAENGEVITPLLVDSATRTILDGHHRHAAALKLGLKFVPCQMVDYLNDESVVVSSWREGTAVSKRCVIEAASHAKLMPPKTSRHVWDCQKSCCRTKAAA